MPRISNSLRDIQHTIAKEVVLSDELPVENIKTIAAFDCTALGSKLVCAAVVVEFPSMKILEKQHLVKAAPMPYVPGYLAFREGPLILELAYKLENNPDLVIVNGHGIAHSVGCGLACYVGVELHMPAIGVAKGLLIGKTDGGLIMLGEKTVGKTVQTRQFAKPVFVTPGHLITIDTAAELVRRCIVPPHKLPEPLHIAHRNAAKIRDAMIDGAGKTSGQEAISSPAHDSAAQKEKVEA